MVFLVALFLSLTANAQNLELKNVVRQGLDFSPEVKRAEATWKASQYGREQRERLLFPQIDLIASAALRDQPAQFNSTTNTFNNPLSGELYDGYLRLIQPLYRGGALVNGIGRFKVAEEIERQRWFDTRQAAVESLVFAYYDFAKTERMLALTSEHAEVLKSYADIVSRYERIGRSRRMDRLQATVNLSLNSADQLDLDRRRTAAADALRRLLGAPESKPAIASDAKITIAAAATPTLEQAFQATVENNPELQIAELQRQRQEYENALDFVADKPQLNIEAQWGYRSDERPNWFEERYHYYSVGLVLTVPLFSGFSSLSKRRVHTEVLRESDRLVEIRRLDLRQRLQSFLTDVTSEFTRLTVAQTAVQQGREALQLATEAYRQGVASNQDVLNAQQTRYRSEQVLIESQFSYLRALLSLRRLMGVDLEKVYAQ